VRRLFFVSQTTTTTATSRSGFCFFSLSFFIFLFLLLVNNNFFVVVVFPSSSSGGRSPLSRRRHDGIDDEEEQHQFFSRKEREKHKDKKAPSHQRCVTLNETLFVEREREKGISQNGGKRKKIPHGSKNFIYIIDIPIEKSENLLLQTSSSELLLLQLFVKRGSDRVARARAVFFASSRCECSL